MNRSVGVTVIAVLALIGSALTLLIGILVAVVMAFVPMPAQSEFPASPMFLKAMVLIGALFYVIPALWGIFASIGLFRLKNWARISMIVFAVLLILMSAFGELTALLLPAFPVANGPPDASIMNVMRLLLGGFWAVLLGLGIWWLVFFNRAKVKQQFVPLLPAVALSPSSDPTQDPAASATAVTRAPNLPLSFTIIAWLLLVCTLFLPLNLLLHTPAVFLTRIVHGWPAGIYYVVLTALLLYIGVGLLRFQRAARVVAIAYFLVTFLNSAVFYLVPGGRARMQSLVESQQAMFPWMRPRPTPAGLQFDLTPFMIVGACSGLAVLAVALYFLITRKQAFEAAVAAH
jgi:hypothetical protein